MIHPLTSSRLSEQSSRNWLVFAAHMCQSEVCNGGFPQFFFNSTGVLAPEAVQGFIAIGMPQTSKVVFDAMAFFGMPFPRDRNDRMAMLTGFEQNVFESLEDRFYDLIGSENGGFDEAALAALTR